jgi:hypothetical protein
MSIGNLKDSGNQGNNFPYQLRVLQGLQALIDDISTGIDVAITSPIGQQPMADSVSVTLASDQSGVERTPTFARPAGSNGSTTAGIFSASFASVGTGNAIVGGIVLKPGETLNFDAGAINNTLASIAYDTTTNAGAELIIITLT